VLAVALGDFVVVEERPIRSAERWQALTRPQRRSEPSGSERVPWIAAAMASKASPSTSAMRVASGGLARIRFVVGGGEAVEFDLVDDVSGR